MKSYLSLPIFLLVFFCLNKTNAQTSNLGQRSNLYDVRDITDWQIMTLDPTINLIKFDSAMKVFQNTFHDQESYEMRSYMRFDRFWGDRLSSESATLGQTGPYRSIFNDFNFTCSEGDWNPLGPDGTNPPHGQMRLGMIRAIYFEPDLSNIIIGSNSSGMWRSTDVGQTWTSLTDNVFNNPINGVREVKADPSNSNNLYAVTGVSRYFDASYGSGLYVSTDAGNTWTRDVNFPYSSDYLLGLKFVGPNNFFVYSSRSLYYYDGSSWSIKMNINKSGTNVSIPANTFNDVFQNIADIEYDPIDGELYVSTSSLYGSLNSQVFKSSDLGNTWTEITSEYTQLEPQGQMRVTYFDYANNSIYASSQYLFGPATLGLAQKNYFSVSPSGQSASLLGVVMNSGTTAGSGNNLDKFGFYVSECSNKILYGVCEARMYDIGSNTASSIAPVGCGTEAVNWHTDTRNIEGFCDLNNDYALIANDGGISIYDIQNNLLSSLNGDNLSLTESYTIGISQDLSKIHIGNQDHGTMRKVPSSWFEFSEGDGGPTIISKDGRFTSNVLNRLNEFDLTGSSYSHNTFNQTAWHLRREADLFDKPNEYAVLSGGARSLYGESGPYNLFKYEFSIDPVTGTKTYSGPINYDVTEMNVVGAIRFNPNNKDSYYIATMDNNSSATGQLLKTTDDGATWQDLSNSSVSSSDGSVLVSLHEVTRWRRAKSIEISSDDENAVWIGLSGVGSETNPNNPNIISNFRVLKSNDGGLNWVDMSKGLPLLPVNKIIRIEGTNDMLVVATDGGVFYRDNSMSEWVCFNNNLPKCIVTDVEYNYCEKQLYVSTYGRGSHFSGFEPEILDALIVTQNTTISDEQQFYGNVRVTSGAKLTVTGDLYFSTFSRLIVEPGGELQINGGLLTSICGGLWPGIELRGNSSLSQNSGNQGKVSMVNGATIENARNGIATIAYNSNGNQDWTMTGGVIQADNSIFRNNKRDVEFLRYTSGTIDNISYFRECQFITTDNLLGGEEPYAHVTMYGTDGVNFLGNVFENSNPNIDIPEGAGIISIDASYQVDDYCTVPTLPGQPCSSPIKNEFNDLFIGIANWEGGRSQSDINVNNAEFNKCVYGLRMEGAKWGQIANSTFNMSKSNLTVPLFPDSYGITTLSGDGFLIYQNEFNNLEAGNIGSAGRNFGCFIDNSSLAPANIFFNTFNFLETNLQTEGDNPVLEFDCNDFNSGAQTTSDVYYADGYLGPQGLSVPDDDEDLQANIFSPGPCGSGKWKILNSTINIFNYEDHARTSTNAEPNTCMQSVVYNDGNAGSFDINGACEPLNLNDPIIDKVNDARLKYDQANIELNDITNQFDEGDFQTLLAFIQSSSSNQIKGKLISLSPYVSDEILIELIQGSYVTPGHLKQILLANSPLSKEVQFVLSNSSQPSGTVNQVQNAQTDGPAANSEIYTQIDVKTNEKLTYLSRIVRAYLDTNWVDSAINVLENDNSIYASCMLVPLASQTDSNLSKQHINRIELEALNLRTKGDTLRAEAMEEFCNFYNQLIPVIQRPGGYYDLFKEEIIILENIAARDLGISANANAIISFINEDYGSVFALPYPNDLKSDIVSGERKRIKKYELYPNPAEGIINFELMKGDFQAFDIFIYNGLGQLIQKERINNMKQMIGYDVSFLTSGIYLVQLNSPDDSHVFKLVIE